MAAILIISVFAMLIIVTAFYNSLVDRKKTFDEAFGGSDVQMMNRRSHSSPGRNPEKKMIKQPEIK